MATHVQRIFWWSRDFDDEDDDDDSEEYEYEDDEDEDESDDEEEDDEVVGHGNKGGELAGTSLPLEPICLGQLRRCWHQQAIPKSHPFAFLQDQGLGSAYLRFCLVGLQ